MKKYLVNVYLPSLNQHYDVFLPTGKKIDEAIWLLVRIFEALSGGTFMGTAETLLLNADNGEPFEQNMTVYDAGIRNASKLILI
ncbi:MAG TPA: hypothetical protein GX717_04740 [Clostridiaceae bacterium]|nr:hypothetical protein [Clostridiaceae bacterium]